MDEEDVVDGYVVRGLDVNTDEVLRLVDVSDPSFAQKLVDGSGGDHESFLSLLKLLKSSVAEEGDAALVRNEKTMRDLADRSWERLHTGRWDEESIVVVVGSDDHEKKQHTLDNTPLHGVHRWLFAAFSLLVAKCESMRGQWSNVTSRLDKVLLLGHSDFHPMTQRALQSVPSASLPKLKKRNTEENEEENNHDGEVRLDGVVWPSDPSCLDVPQQLLRFPSCPEYASSWPSLDAFRDVHLRPAHPCVLRGFCTSWPAFEKWRDVSYLAQVLGSRTVPVELGEHYMHESFSQQLMQFGEFLRKHVLQPTPETPVGYLAQTQLLQQVPQLMRDILIPDYCCLSDKESLPAINAWLGPAGTVSPLHTDPNDNIFVQLVGKKVILLHPSSENSKLYAVDGLMNNTSAVDARAPDLNAFPLYADAKGYCVEVNEGDALFIPKGMWHFVMSRTPSWSLSFWF